MAEFLDASLTHRSVSLCFTLNEGVLDSLSLEWLTASLTAGNYVTLREALTIVLMQIVV